MLNNATPDKLLITVREAARLLSISERTLFSLTAPRGPISVVKLGGRSLRFSVADLQRFIESRREGGPKSEPEPKTEQV